MKERIIKFKSYNKELKKSTEINLHENESENNIIKIQCIGRTDCKGNYVYNGSIFRDKSHTYIVYWNENACGFKIKTIGGGNLIAPKYNNLEGVIKNLEVCGNIIIDNIKF